MGIYYFCPDFPQPSGGTKTLYRHVWRLNQLGFQAAIVHQKSGFQLTWHDYLAPVLWLEEKPPFRPDDILIFPEVMIDTIRQTSHFQGTRVVFALSWLPQYSRLKPGERWQDHGIEHVITKSPTIQRHLAWSMEIESTLIPDFINPDLYFQPSSRDEDEQETNNTKKNIICYTTRKDQSGAWLQGILTRKGSPNTDFSWMPLREMNEPTYAANLRKASIYLATTLQEGMHVSILEAMACGTLVVGYSGIGGEDYMVGEGAQQNCILVENGNLLSLGMALEQVLIDITSEPKVYESIVRQGRQTAKQYQDPQREEEALSGFFSRLLCSC